MWQELYGKWTYMEWWWLTSLFVQFLSVHMLQCIHTCDDPSQGRKILQIYIVHVSCEWPCKHINIYLFFVIFLQIYAKSQKLHKVWFGIQIQVRTSWNSLPLHNNEHLLYIYINMLLGKKFALLKWPLEHSPKSCMWPWEWSHVWCTTVKAVKTDKTNWTDDVIPDHFNSTHRSTWTLTCSTGSMLQC
jgi:hypothetical protein